ncbi:hypothetical protein DTO169C6_6646 [Paecilomyces variotii]|nr:hypothetical protein DTO169C6_6646 [Paecilomyces variotii]
MTYFNRQVIRQYLDNVNLVTREDAVDQLWINILRYYFNDLDCFGIEAQSRPHQDWDYRSNVVVANVRNYIMAKFLFVENKRSSFEDDPRIGIVPATNWKTICWGLETIRATYKSCSELWALGIWLAFTSSQ